MRNELPSAEKEKLNGEASFEGNCDNFVWFHVAA